MGWFNDGDMDGFDRKYCKNVIVEICTAIDERYLSLGYELPSWYSPNGTLKQNLLLSDYDNYVVADSYIKTNLLLAREKILSLIGSAYKYVDPTTYETLTENSLLELAGYDDWFPVNVVCDPYPWIQMHDVLDLLKIHKHMYTNWSLPPYRDVTSIENTSCSLSPKYEWYEYEDAWDNRREINPSAYALVPGNRWFIYHANAVPGGGGTVVAIQNSSVVFDPALCEGGENSGTMFRLDNVFSCFGLPGQKISVTVSSGGQSVIIPSRLPGEVVEEPVLSYTVYTADPHIITCTIDTAEPSDWPCIEPADWLVEFGPVGGWTDYMGPLLSNSTVYFDVTSALTYG